MFQVLFQVFCCRAEAACFFPDASTQVEFDYRRVIERASRRGNMSASVATGTETAEAAASAASAASAEESKSRRNSLTPAAIKV